MPSPLMKFLPFSVLVILLATLLSGCGGGSTTTSVASTPTATSSGKEGNTNTEVAIAPWVGVKQLGVANALTMGISSATDASGNVYISGYTTGGLDGNQLVGIQDGFITKYNISGVRQFTKQIGASGASTTAHSVTTDNIGNFYAAGDTNQGLDGNTRFGSTDMFLSKYDQAGVKVFTLQLGVSGVDTVGRSVTTDINGNIYVTGVTKGGLDGNSLIGNQDAFIVKYNSSGAKQWTKQFGVVNKVTNNYGVALDSSGNIYLAGHTTGGLDGNTLSGIQDFYIAKYDATGTKVWIKQFGATGATVIGRSVATDLNGNVYIAGATNFGLNGNIQAGIQDFYVAKYDGAGVMQYIRQSGVTSAITNAQGVATDLVGSIYVVGYTNGNLDSVSLTGTQDAFVTKYDSAGVKQFSQLLGAGGASSVGRGVSEDRSGNLFLAGSTTGGIDGNTLLGTQDFFLAKYNNSGSKQ
jgi:hypothetical protein